MPQPTRTLFFHIGIGQQVAFYALAALASAICGWGIYRRYRLWQAGRPERVTFALGATLRRIAVQAFGHRRIARRKFAGHMHMLVFYGFGALFVGTCIVAVEHYGALVFGEHWLYRGWFFLLCKVTLDVLGAGLVIGLGLALGRRHLARPGSLGQAPFDSGFLALLLVATLTGFALEGAGIAADPTRHPWAAWSPIGGLVARLLHGLGYGGYATIWWVHITLVLSVIALLPYGKRLHLFIIPATLATKPERPMGALKPVTMAEVEDTGRIGLGLVGDISRQELMSLDGCMECGRCTDACPANAAGKPLDPKRIVLDIRSLLAEGAAATTDSVADEAIWACTNCHTCVRECPALIRHVDIIDGIRRYRVAEGRIAGAPAAMLRQMTGAENPWGLPAQQRLDWADGMNVQLAGPEDGREVLLWVGCAGAFDPNARRTVRALAMLLERAGVRYSVLGPKERCTGDPARRIGDEFLFQQLAEANIATLNGVGRTRIVTQCPHCMHTLRNEYPQLGGDYEVMHHTQFLAELVEAGRLNPAGGPADAVVYHDPCYLARVNGETAAPRSVLGSSGAQVTELARRESRTFCCGAGGGRMWMEDDPDHRPNLIRAREIADTGVPKVAVACPFCRVMVSDGLAALKGEDAPEVLDVAELMLAAVDSHTQGAHAG